MAFFWKYSGGKNIHPFPPVPDSTTYLNAITAAVQSAQLTNKTVSAAMQGVQSQYAPLIASQIKNAKSP